MAIGLRGRRNLATIVSGLQLLVSAIAVGFTCNCLLKSGEENRLSDLPYAAVSGLSLISGLYSNERRKFYNSKLNN